MKPIKKKRKKRKEGAPVEAFQSSLFFLSSLRGSRCAASGERAKAVSVTRRPREAEEKIGGRDDAGKEQLLPPPPHPHQEKAVRRGPEGLLTSSKLKTQSFEGETDLNISSQAFSPTRACNRQAESARL